MAYVIGIDLGTSGTKTALFDETGALIASETIEYPLYQPHPGWAEQDPADWWDASAAGIRAVLDKSGVGSGEIAAVGIAGQMHGLVMLDGDGKVLRRSIIWCDQRTAAECEEITARVGAARLIEITANPALTGFTASKILWVRNNEPQIYDRCRHILLPKDYIRYELTGEFATEVSDASGMQLLDIPKRQWSAEVLDKLEIDPALLGKVYESPQITGAVSASAAARTGLRPGTPVVGGAGDNAAAAIGTGVAAEGRAFTTIGTSGVVYAHTDAPHIDPLGRVHTFCCAVPGAWHVMGVTQAAGLSLRWYRDQFCAAEREAAAAMGTDPYVLMDKEAALSPIGAQGLFYLPYLMGERTPHLDPAARGAFIGLTGVHTRRDMLRAVMEGVTYSLCDCLSVLKEMSLSPAEMVACGGGGSSPLWRQMLADAFRIPVKTAHSKEGAALGAAILAATGAGIFASVPEGCDAWIRYNPAQPPKAEDAQQYANAYAVYRTLYPALRDAYKAIAQL